MSAQHSTSSTAVLARIFWMAMGPVFLAVFSLTIVNRGSGWITPLDIAYFVVLLGMVVARWVEFKDGDPRTAFGEPATRAHLRKFIVLILGAGIGIWVLANFVGNHLLKG